MNTVTFVYTDGITYKATNVQHIEKQDSVIEYTQSVINESGTVGGINLRAVDLSDLLYAVVKNQETKEVTIIPGIFDNFEVVPKGVAVQRQANIEAEAARIAADRAAKAPEREAKEKAKYEQRRKARKEAWEAEHGVPQLKGKAPNVAPVAAPVVATEETADTGVFAALTAAGINERDMSVLRDLLK